MSKTCFILNIIALAAAICITTLTNVSFAQEQGPRDLNNYSCKDVMRFSGEQRSIAIAFLHGYFQGKKGTTLFNTEELSHASDQFVEYCLDNPNMKAHDAMRKYVK